MLQIKRCWQVRKAKTLTQFYTTFNGKVQPTLLSITHARLLVNLGKGEEELVLENALSVVGGPNSQKKKNVAPI